MLSIQAARPADVKGLIHIRSLGPVEGQTGSTWSLLSFSGGSNPMSRREGPVSLWAASLGWGVGCTGVQLRGGDLTDLGWGAPDIRVSKAPGSCELHLGCKSVLWTWSHVSVSM